MSNEFSHLHVHSDYSLLDGLGKIGDYVKYGKSLGNESNGIYRPWNNGRIGYSI